MLQSFKKAWVRNAYIEGVQSIIFIGKYSVPLCIYPMGPLYGYTVTNSCQLERVQRRYSYLAHILQ